MIRVLSNTSASGSQTGERDGSNGTNGKNNYTDTSDEITVTSAGFGDAVKSVDATSESSTTGNNLTIGEVVRYRLVVSIPEGQIENLQITDALPEGLRYLDDGSAAAALVADDANQISSSDSSIGSATGNETTIDAM